MKKNSMLLIILLVMSTLCATMASAAIALTATSISDSVQQGDTLTATSTITNTGDNVNITSITISDLNSGGNTINAGSITISPTNQTNFLNGDSLLVTISSTIGVSQPAGTYIGTLDINANNGTATNTQTATVSIVVTEAPRGTLTFTDATIGSSSQERDEETLVRERFTITNNGVLDVTGVNVTLENVDAKYQAVVVTSPTIIPAGSSVNVDVDALVPLEQNAGIEAIGIIRATGIAGTTVLDTTHNLNVQAENNLEIKDVKAIARQDTDTVKSDGDEFDFDNDEEPRPGEEITFEVEIENTFNDDIDIEDIEITIINDDDLDWDETEDVGRLREGREHTAEFVLDIDKDVDEDTYTLEIEVIGIDENDAEHKETWEVDIEIIKEDDDLRIDNAQFSPSYVDCDDNNVKLLVNIENVGEDDQERGVLLVQNRELDIEQIIKSIAVDEGEDTTKTLIIPLPDNLVQKTYRFDIFVYTSANDDDLTDYSEATLNVLNCESETTTEEDEENDTVIEVVTPPATTTSGTVVSSTTGKPISKFITGGNDNLYIALLVVIIVLLVALIIIAGNAMSGKKK